MTKLMGILNITPDSFSDNGKYFDNESALNRFNEMVKQGANIIDIGCQSTRPGATLISAEEEWARLEPFLISLKNKKTPISIDSFYPEVISRALEYNISYINDVSGGNDEMAQLAAKSGKKLIFMHSLTIPADKEKTIPEDTDIISYLAEWLEQKIKTLTSLGIKKENLIFDPGLGFGKTAKQSMEIILNISQFKKFDIEILVGHSRKSFLKLFTQKPPEERVSQTAKFSYYLAANGVDYLRVHDIIENKHALEFGEKNVRRK